MRKLEKKRDNSIDIRKKVALMRSKCTVTLVRKTCKNLAGSSYTVDICKHTKFYSNFVPCLIYKPKYTIGKFCALWNETIRERCASDVTSAYPKAMQALSAQSSFTFWCDNCSAQNKNWAIVCGLWQFAPQLEEIGQIKIKYLKKSHTSCDFIQFMGA